MKKHYVITCSVFKTGALRAYMTYIDASNLTTYLQYAGLDATFEEDADQSEH